MFNSDALYGMMPNIDYKAWIPSVDATPLNQIMKLTETIGDPTLIIRKQVETMLGFEIPKNASPEELGQAFALRLMMKAVTQIPLELFDPLAPYKAQAQLISKGNWMIDFSHSNSKGI